MSRRLPGMYPYGKEYRKLTIERERAAKRRELIKALSERRDAD